MDPLKDRLRNSGARRLYEKSCTEIHWVGKYGTAVPVGACCICKIQSPNNGSLSCGVQFEVGAR